MTTALCGQIKQTFTPTIRYVTVLLCFKSWHVVSVQQQATMANGMCV